MESGQVILFPYGHSSLLVCIIVPVEKYVSWWPTCVKAGVRQVLWLAAGMC